MSAHILEQIRMRIPYFIVIICNFGHTQPITKTTDRQYFILNSDRSKSL